MPDITELLREAAPSPRPFDESALRRRVGVRRRRRWSIAVGALVVLAGVGVAASMLTREPVEQGVITNEPPVVADEITALTLVHDDVWTAGDGFVQAGDTRLEVDGAVLGLATGDLVWAVGSTWVEPFDESVPASLGGRWIADAVITDVQPLADRSLAVALSNGEVVILQWFEAETTVQQAIELPGGATDLVLTLGNELWVNDGDVICRIDVDAGVAVDDQPWSGPLLAPSRSGGIWTMDGMRVVDLHPENLDDGVSVAQGDRYEASATIAVETDDGLYVGGPEGLSRHDAEGGEVIDIAEPDALAGNDDLVVYLVDGEVRRAHTEDPRAEEQANLAEMDRRLAHAIEARQADHRFVRAELGWVDVTMGEGRSSEDGTVFTQTASSPSLGQTVALYHDMNDGWRLTGFTTLSDQDNHSSVRLGTGDDVITFDFGDPVLTPELRVTYGEETVLVGERGGRATWNGDLGFRPDLPGTVSVLWRNDEGVVVEGLGFELPPGAYRSQP